MTQGESFVLKETASHHEDAGVSPNALNDPIWPLLLSNVD